MAAAIALLSLPLGLVPLAHNPLYHAQPACRVSFPSIVAHAPAPRRPQSIPQSEDASVTGNPVARVGRYLHVQLVRPLVVHVLIAYSTILRHSYKRSVQKKAEFEDNASRITWIGALVNLVLAVFKAFAGVYGHSAAMIADAGHSFSDLFSDGLTLLSVRMSSLPADVDHPYGHGRFESVGSLAIGAILVGVGFSFGATAITALRSPAPASLGRIALWAAALSIVSKEILFQATAAIGRRERSQVLLANAWHHRSDALSSVVAFAGIGGSLLGWRMLDPLAGILVAGLVSWMGLSISVEALAQLTDTSDYDVVSAVELVAGGVVGVDNVNQVRLSSARPLGTPLHRLSSPRTILPARSRRSPTFPVSARARACRSAPARWVAPPSSTSPSKWTRSSPLPRPTASQRR